MDIDHPVRNSTNNTVGWFESGVESEVSKEVSDENTEPRRKIQTNRALQMSTAEIDEIKTKTAQRQR